MCGETHRMATNEGKQTRMWKPKYVIYFKLPYWSSFCSEWRGSRRVDSKSFLSILFVVKSFIQRNLLLEIFYLCAKDRKVKNDAAAEKAKMKRYHHLTFFFFHYGALWYPENRWLALIFGTQGEDHCIGTKPRRTCVYKHLHEQRAFELFNSFFSPPAGVH